MKCCKEISASFFENIKRFIVEDEKRKQAEQEWRRAQEALEAEKQAEIDAIKKELNDYWKNKIQEQQKKYDAKVSELQESVEYWTTQETSARKREQAKKEQCAHLELVLNTYVIQSRKLDRDNFADVTERLDDYYREYYPTESWLHRRQY